MFNFSATQESHLVFVPFQSISSSREIKQSIFQEAIFFFLWRSSFFIFCLIFNYAATATGCYRQNTKCVRLPQTQLINTECDLIFTKCVLL